MATHRLPDHFMVNTELSESERDFLAEQLNAFNVRQTGARDFQWLGMTIHAQDGTIMAGISGWTWGGCCEIRSLWVTEALRGQGIGRQLLQIAEREAAKRGCAVVVLDTHSFQAPHFYQKHGYMVVGIVEGYPRGHQKYYFQKQLN